MRNKKAPVAAALGFTMILGLVQPVSVQAAVKKDENVYVTLQEDGSVSKLYVVNAFTAMDMTMGSDMESTSGRIFLVFMYS